MKSTLLREQNTLRAVSQVPFDGLLRTFGFIDQYLTALYLEKEVLSPLYLASHPRDDSERQYLALCTCPANFGSFSEIGQ
jgi:hypothetical protein